MIYCLLRTLIYKLILIDINMSEKMNSSTLRNSVKELNDLTNNEYVVNSFDTADSNKTQYGLMKINKDGTMDLVLRAKYTKREIFYHITGYLLLSEKPISTKVKTSK